MGFWKTSAFSIMLVALAAIGCGDDENSGGDGGTGGSAGTGGTGGSAGTGGTGGSAGTGGTGGSAGTGGSPMGAGSATLMIGTQTWEFDSFQCAFGYDATQSNTYSFSSGAIQTIDGVRLQLLADIEDDSGQERYEGEGVLYDVTIQDIENFDDPTVDWQAYGPAAEIVVRIDGDSVTAEGVFDDLRTLEIEEVPGTLDATCGSNSIR